MIKVVNIRNYKPEKDWVLIKVDRSSVLGNPFKMKFPTPAMVVRNPNYNKDERNRVCDEYAEYFNRKVKEEGSFRNEVIRIYRLAKSGQNIALGCWCAPKRCHAMHIKQFLDAYLD